MIKLNSRNTIFFGYSTVTPIGISKFTKLFFGCYFV